MPNRPGVRVLDVGCGTGQLLCDIGRRLLTAHLYGIDLAPGMVVEAKRHLARSVQKADIICADSERLPFADSSLDLITCAHSFHHYPNQALAIGEFARVLAPEGTLMILDGDPTSMWGHLLYEVIVRGFEGSVRHCSDTRYLKLLSGHGFVDVHFYRRSVFSPVLLAVGRLGATKTTDCGGALD
jgi:ubiquinone/menaquinone biosynthesis C-methylase UbiE